MQVTQEQHDLFANGLALLLPDTPGGEKSVAIASAREGQYRGSRNTFWGMWFVTGPEYWSAQKQAIEELWRAVYETAPK